MKSFLFSRIDFSLLQYILCNRFPINQKIFNHFVWLKKCDFKLSESNPFQKLFSENFRIRQYWEIDWYCTLKNLIIVTNICIIIHLLGIVNCRFGAAVRVINTLDSDAVYGLINIWQWWFGLWNKILIYCQFTKRTWPRIEKQ